MVIRLRPCMRSSTSLLRATPPPPHAGYSADIAWRGLFYVLPPWPQNGHRFVGSAFSILPPWPLHTDIASVRGYRRKPSALDGTAQRSRGKKQRQQTIDIAAKKKTERNLLVPKARKKNRTQPKPFNNKKRRKTKPRTGSPRKTDVTGLRTYCSDGATSE